MKKLVKLYIAVVLLFVALFVTSNLLFKSFVKRNNDAGNILMNRVVDGIRDKYIMRTLQYSNIDPLPGPGIQKIIDSYMKDNRSAFIHEYGYSALPDEVEYISLSTADGTENVNLINNGKSSDKVWSFYGKDDKTLIGLIVFRYNDERAGALHIILNVSLIAAFLISIGICLYISSTVLRPFEKLSDYPVKLSKNEITEKLPETKNRLFGRFIWGINMLSDNIQNKQKRVDELSRDHMTMLTTIAHGIKTPVANIKLYADAISTGLYQPDGQVNKSDAEIAAKISKNADDVTELVRNLIDKATDTVVNFTPEIAAFYLEELRVFLEEEYSNRLNMLHIPYSFTINHNAMLKSDKSGICRILSQLMDNAIKYGNGERITVNLNKEEDGFYFIIKNKGNLPSEKELPYIFNSFWRGTNAEGIDGNGIGLFEAREIALGLGGDIYVRTDQETREIEFDVYIGE